MPRVIEALERVAGGAGDRSTAGGGGSARGRLATPLYPQPYQWVREALERAADKNMSFRVAVDTAQRNHTQQQQGLSGSPDNKLSPPSGDKGKVAVFGFECDSALHLAIKQHATEATLGLIRLGTCINVLNEKVSNDLDCACLFYLFIARIRFYHSHFIYAQGITPLMITSQE